MLTRQNYSTDEHRLRKEFELFGHIRNLTLVRDKNTQKSRGYAFIEFENKREFKRKQACLTFSVAYNQGNGRRIDGNRVLVDYEKGRTIEAWLPRRLGGGEGGDQRRSKKHEQMIRTLKKKLPPSRSRSREKEREREERKTEKEDPGRRRGRRGQSK